VVLSFVFLQGAHAFQRRKLGPSELLCKMFHDDFSGFMNVVATAHLKGRLSLPLLKKACQEVYQLQPLLHVRIDAQKDEFFFATDVSFQDIPFIVIDRKGQDHWQKIVSDQLHELFKIDRFLWRIIVLTDQKNNSHEVFFVSMHSAGDGVSMMHMFDQLFTIYSQLEAGKPVSAKSLEFLPPVEELMLHQPTADEVKLSHERIGSERPTTWMFDKNAPFSQRRTKNIYRNLSPELLKKLKLRCKIECTTVNAALNAALVVAAQKYHGASVNVRLSTPVNLRQRYCRQVVDNSYVGHYFTVATSVEPDVNDKVDFWQIARIYNNRLKKMIPVCASVPRGMTYQEAVQFCKKLAQPRDHFVAGFSVSNVGQLDFSSHYGSLEMTGLHFCSNRSLGFTVMILNVLSFNDQMFMCFSYADPLLSDENAHLLVDYHIDSLLKNL